MGKREEAQPTPTQPAVRQDAGDRGVERATRAKAIVQPPEIVEASTKSKSQKSKKTADSEAAKKSKKSQAAEDGVTIPATESAAN